MIRKLDGATTLQLRAVDWWKELTTENRTRLALKYFPHIRFIETTTDQDKIKTIYMSELF